MLVLTRNPENPVILIGPDIRVTILGVRSRGQVRVGIEAPGDVRIMREELVMRDRDGAGDGRGGGPR